MEPASPFQPFSALCFSRSIVMVEQFTSRVRVGEEVGQRGSLSADQRRRRCRQRSMLEDKSRSGPAEPNGQTSSFDVRKAGGEESLVDIPVGDCALPYQPTSLPVPVRSRVRGRLRKQNPSSLREFRTALSSRRCLQIPKNEGRWLHAEIAGSSHHHAVASGGCRSHRPAWRIANPVFSNPIRAT
jgi:hypothetical protein